MKNKELAVNGGRPVRDTFLPASRECLDEADISAVVNVLRRGNLCGGELVAALEERFAGYAGVRYAVAVSSGGAGLHITAAAAGISLRAENIGVAVPDPPLHRHPFFIWQGHKDVCTLEGSLCPRADDLYETFLLLPVYPALTDGDVTDVIQAVYKVLDNYSDNL